MYLKQNNLLTSNIKGDLIIQTTKIKQQNYEYVPTSSYTETQGQQAGD